MNVHGAIDVGTIGLSALLLGDEKFFANGIDTEPIVEVAADAETTIPDVSCAGEHEVTVATPVGEFEAAYMPWQWRGPEYPTLIFHHGSGERPFDFGRFSSNSFRRLFVASDRDVQANLVAVRAPFHDGSNRDYARAMGDASNFVGMLAASAALIEAVATRAADRTTEPVVASGISLGGWAVNLHRACFEAVDHYVPIFAGAALGEMFVSSVYRKMTAVSARRRPDRLRHIFDFEEPYTAVDATDCSPLLARYDRIIEFDQQRSCYDGLPLAVLDRGHVTGSLATPTLRDHIVDALLDSNESAG